MCNSLAQACANFAIENKEQLKSIDIMKSTDFTLEALSGLFSTENAYREMMDMVQEMGLELTDIRPVRK